MSKTESHHNIHMPATDVGSTNISTPYDVVAQKLISPDAVDTISSSTFNLLNSIVGAGVVRRETRHHHVTVITAIRHELYWPGIWCCDDDTCVYTVHHVTEATGALL